MGINQQRYIIVWVSIILLVAISGVSLANNEVINLTQDPKHWATWGGNYAGTRYSPIRQINRDNVEDLQLAWTFSTGVLRGHEGGPLVINDVVYIHTPFPNKVFAINQKDKTIIWQYTPIQNENETIPVMCCDTVNRGLAYGDGKIFLQQADTTLVALDAGASLIDRNNDGEVTEADRVVWKVKNGDPKLGMTNTQAPVVMKDKVITGISGGEFGVRGFIAAYDIKNGKPIWKGYSMGPDKDMLIDAKNTMTWRDGKLAPVGKNSSLKTWEGDQWKVGGGSTWGWYSYDPKLNLLYYGSGNPGTWNPVQRPGDNKWSMSIWARDLDSGSVKWVYQMTPHDEWDYDGVNEMVLVDQKIKGKIRKLLVHFDRNGFAYTLDRVSGELLVAEKYDKAVNWASRVDLKTGRPVVSEKYSTEFHGEDENTKDICPSALGTKNQQPVAFSPKTELFYVPTNHVCMNYEPFEVEYTAGQPYVGATLLMYPAGKDVLTGKALPKNHRHHRDLGAFTAWDARTGKIAWSKPEPFSVWSGALATAGDIVFHGTLEGYLKARDADTGKELYRFKTPSGIIGNVNTWTFEGKQYVGVLSGLGGWAGIGMAAGMAGNDGANADQSNANDTEEDEEKCAEGLGTYCTYKDLNKHTQLGGGFSVFALPGSIDSE